MLRSVPLTLCALAGLTFGEVVRAADKPTEEPLAAALNELAADSAKRLPPELLKSMKEAVDGLRATGIEKSARQVGDQAIDAELTGWNGETTRLSDLWKEGSIVLMWYRGGWCPYCNVQLRAMQKQLAAIEGAGAHLVVLTPELPAKAKETAAANDLSIVAFHDKNLKLARQYGLVFQIPDSLAPLYRDRLKLAEFNGSDALELPLSATYVIDRGGVIRYAFLDADYKKRAEPADIVAAVQRLTEK